DSKNEISDLSLFALGLRTEAEMNEGMFAAMNGQTVDLSTRKSWTYDEIRKMEFRVLLASECYEKQSDETYLDLSTTAEGREKLYTDENLGFTLKVVGIARPKGEKDIAFGPRNMKLSEEEIGLRVREAAKFSGLDEELLQKSPFDLSGGQKRRVALAGVIAMRPEVLVLDEPAAGLDPAGRTRILDGILHYQRSTNSTVLIVSHSMEDMARYCDDVVVMGGARVLMHGERKEIFSHTRELTEAGLDIPQITHLMRLLRERGVSVPENIYTVEDAVSAVRALFAD
ncbi:MAG: ATP-binding cassette domain-containing protein, partial [Clostridia bacterium]|nr:ATP-binding cassette domain-containing protein [Clostridia bacterium]